MTEPFVSGMLSELQALIDSLPPQFVKYDDPMVDQAAARWLRGLDAARREALHRELLEGLPREEHRHDDRFFWIARLEPSPELVEHAVAEARRRGIRDEPPPNGGLWPPWADFHTDLITAVRYAPVPAGICYVEEIARHLPTAQHDMLRSLARSAAISLCYIRQAPASCLVPVLEAGRAWNDRAMHAGTIRLAKLLWRRRGMERDVRALLRPEELELFDRRP